MSKKISAEKWAEIEKENEVWVDGKLLVNRRRYNFKELSALVGVHARTLSEYYRKKEKGWKPTPAREAYAKRRAREAGDVRKAVQELRLKGLRVHAIAKRLGISKSSVQTKLAESSSRGPYFAYKLQKLKEQEKRHEFTEYPVTGKYFYAWPRAARFMHVFSIDSYNARSVCNLAAWVPGDRRAGRVDTPENVCGICMRKLRALK